mmetsp:Transcript_13661/g.21397  ORF Transcript_13661/g.21397 Transcript_13661/m.21397 type:complete len:89 (-) Transcript_13661:731-997(-)
MKSCGLETAESSYFLDMETANRSISVVDITRNKGHTCYYKFVLSNDTFEKETAYLDIYPSGRSNIDLIIANGTSRKTAREFVKVASSD